MNRTILSLAIVALVAPLPAFAQQASAPPSVTGITAPSDVRKIGFEVRGVVSKVDVKKNDAVKAGQPLIALQDAQERAALAQAKLAADVALEVAEAEQTYTVKQLEYARKVKVYEDDKIGSSELEMKIAEAEMNISKLRIDKAKHEGAQHQAEADAQAARLEKMNRTVPADFEAGQVSEVSVKAGEQVDETKPVIELVDLDPLYVNVTLVDTAVVQRMKLGDQLKVKYGDESQWRTATVDAIDPSANAASNKHPFRLKLPNPEMRNAGLKVEIQLPTAGVAGTN